VFEKVLKARSIEVKLMKQEAIWVFEKVE